MFYLLILLKFIILILPVLLAVAYMTLFERKILSAIQIRQGPSFIGFYGLLQPFADALKLLTKETIIPFLSNRFLFIFSPLLTFIISSLLWVVIPFDENLIFADLNLGILYILTLSSLGVYGLIIAGWSSNSRYAFLGGLRAAAQMISYEVSIGLILMSILVPVGSLNLIDIVLFQSECIWFIFLYPGLFLMFLVSILAETNRPPFDLPEAEAELVSGYNVEYSAVGFALFFIGEYMNIIFMSSLCVILFLGGWDFFSLKFIKLYNLGLLFFSLKVLLILFFFVWVRAAFPRYRYDQLMYIGWKVFLPLSFSLLFFNLYFFYITSSLPSLTFLY
jgi:NADH-quinone oxidoreductase subunit H